MPQSRTVVRSSLVLALVVGAAGPGIAALTAADTAARPGDAAATGRVQHAARPGTNANPVKAKDAVKDGFVPYRLVVPPRQRVWFISVDRLVHTATAYKRVRGKPVFDNRPSAGVFTIRAPKEPGTYRYFCLVHPYQKGVLVVRPRRRPPPRRAAEARRPRPPAGTTPGATSVRRT